LVPRRATSTIHLPPEEWITIAVPALIEPDLFEAVQEQLSENQERVRQQRRGARFLLQGLVRCRQCRYAYYGKATHWKDRQGGIHEYAYYRCIGTDGYRFGGEQVCENRELRVEGLDGAIWQAVCEILEHPQRIALEYQERSRALEGAAVAQEARRAQARLSKVRQGIARLIDSYADGLIEKAEFEPRIMRLRERVGEMEVQVHQFRERAERSTDIEQIIGCLEEFAMELRAGLESADWSTRRAIIRALVKVIEVDRDDVYVVFRIGANPFEFRPEGRLWQHCWRRVPPHA
jgi:site-specific DNA recombinase